MKNLKHLTLVLLAGLLTAWFSGCKKDSKSKDNDMDITQYCIVGKLPTTNNGKSFDVPIFIMLKPNAQAFATTGISDFNYSYTFKNGTLRIDVDGGVQVFTIENEKITNYTTEGTANKLTVYALQKYPDKNEVAGSYTGNMATTDQSLNAGLLATVLHQYLKINDTKFGFSNADDVNPDKSYTLYNNIAGAGNNEGNGTITFFIKLNGKLEVAQYVVTNVNGSGYINYGTYTAK